MAAILSSPTRQARQQPGAAGAEAARRGRNAAAARRGRCCSSPARQARQRYGAAGMGVTAGAAPSRRGRHGVREYKTQRERWAAGRWPALNTTMVELQGTHGGSFGGGQEKELRWIRRTGAYVLLDWRNLLSRITRL
jgi:hypothetical protein